MGSADSKKLSEIIDLVKSWIPSRAKPANMSRDFWMPDESCIVCYECDSHFNVFNRKHHCRLCGRVFCSRCTTNTISALSEEPKNGSGDGDKIRVCNYCFKQHSDTRDNVMFASSSGLGPSSSSASLVSTPQSSCSSAGSSRCSTGPFQHVSKSPHQSEEMDSVSGEKEHIRSPRKVDCLDAREALSDQFESCSRSDEEEDDYSACRSHSEATPPSPSDMGYGPINYCQIDHIYDPHEAHPNEENAHPTCNLPENFDTQRFDYATTLGEETHLLENHVQSSSPSLNELNGADVEAMDYENNVLIWLPPEPEDDEDEKEALISDDDDDAGEDATGEWGYLRSSSFSFGECRSRDRSNEEHRNAMKGVVDGHFRALITQLLNAENLPASEHANWLDIITTLSWEAATLLKPDTSRGGGMDPGGYVKVKCIPCGRRNESTVAKGVVCKKNIAHRRMATKVDKARLLLLGGALEYQRVANHLSSFDTLLQQEKDHLKMAVTKIDVHHPNILLVEKSVSRHAQEYLLEKNISLVLNIKRPLLERIARCTGAQIVQSIDNLSAPKLGYCDSFHVEKFLEDTGTAGQGGKKLTKTLMFFEGCPRRLGCTILLKGASVDELKKVKHVVHYGVFAAYQLALETSFLADEGASMLQLPLTSPIKVALPGKPAGIDRSISTVPGYSVPSPDKPEAQQHLRQAFQSTNDFEHSDPILSEGSIAPNSESEIKSVDVISLGTNCTGPSGSCVAKILGYLDEVEGNNKLDQNQFFESEVSGQGFSLSLGVNKLPSNLDSSELVPVGQHNTDHLLELNEEFPPSPSDHLSILISLSTRCVWKGSVCERAQLFRIKYYGSLDKPLGRYLRDHLFDQGYRCRSCEMPSEAHVHCYTHQEGSLTISVKKLEEFLLPGEKEGKIWMWHRCLRCRRTNGFPPATKRVVMSDAAWGLSFGKFLELSFSNHAAASRVASCGHSLHRDCLRFYGFGRMVACFRYAPIIVNSVYLPPLKLEFNYYKEEWMQKEYDEVCSRADLLFNEALEVLHQISDKIKNDSSTKATESSQQIAELELMLHKEKKEFEESLQCILKNEVKSGQPEMDILEINRLKRQLIFHSYVWDQRFIHVSGSNILRSSSVILKEKPISSKEKRAEMDTVSRSGRGFSSWNPSLVNMKPDNSTLLTDVEPSPINSPIGIHKGADINRTLSSKQGTSHHHSSGTDLSNQADILEFGKTVRRVQSEGQFHVMENVPDNLDAAWTGNHEPETEASKDRPTESSSGINSTAAESVNDRFVAKEAYPLRSPLPARGPNDMENPSSWLRIPFSALYRSFNKNYSTNVQKLRKINEHNPFYISSLRELLHQGGARLLLPMSSCNTIVPIYEDQATSIIAYTLASTYYQKIMSEEPESQKEYSLNSSPSFSILDSFNLLSLHTFEDSPTESLRSLASDDESILSSGSRSFSGFDPIVIQNALHARVTFSDDDPLGKVKYTVTCYCAKQFEALRRNCCVSELDYIRSLSRCKKWGAQGGKSNVYFAKTLDDRFIIKQVTKTELESFIKFAPSYFKYLTDSINSGCPTCLAKIFGIYQVTSKHLKGGKETKMDVLVMENLLFRRNITRLYDLKGSSRSRYNPDSSGSNKVLLDQNLIEAMPTSPIFLGTKAKRLLERAVWNDTSFLASIDVMDYSLLVGVDEEKHELVMGIIDFMRQYTWDKHLETWVKASGILGGPKNASPTVISPVQYKKRFRKAMSAYFLMVPDQWPSSSTIPPNGSCEENLQDRVSA